MQELPPTGNPVIRFLLRGSLVAQIIIGLVAGILLAALAPDAARATTILGDLFVNALKAVAPLLVFILVAAAITEQKQGAQANVGPIIVLYLVGTFAAALVAVVASFLFPSTIHLQAVESELAAPGGVGEVLRNVLLSAVDNPVHAISSANYIGVLTWAIGFGLALRHAQAASKTLMHDLAQAISFIVHVVIRLAPVGIFGLVAATIADTGFSALLQYAQLLAVLLGCMVAVALVANPLIVFLATRDNPFPLVFTCLRESGITAFFMRSSAANIPVNMALAEKLGLDEETYAITIPLGATVNMAGAAITITVMTLAAAHTLGIQVDFLSALLLSLVASVCAAGTSGVAGGSILLIPLACSLFGISDDLAMQVVAVGFIIGVVQDSAETALNSSTDVLLTATGLRWVARRAARTPRGAAPAA